MVARFRPKQVAGSVQAFSTHGADVASAATIDLSAATGNLVDVTGTTTVTAITLADGHESVVRFTGALVLTHGASLVLPGAANVTTVAGDFAVFRGYAAGVVRCMYYVRSARTPDAALLRDGSLAMLGALAMADFNITAAKTVTFGAAPDAQTTGGAVTIDWSAGQKHTLTLSSNATSVAFTAPPGIGNFMLVIKQSGAANFTVAGWAASVKWPGGTAPVITTGSGKVDVLSFYWDGTDYWGQYAQNFL